MFGCQFSNLFHSPFAADSRWRVPTKDGSVQTLLTFESEHIGDGPNVIEFKSSENVFQAAKARRRGDALFVVSLSPGDAARAGQGRLTMKEKVATIYRDFYDDKRESGHIENGKDFYAQNADCPWL